MKAARSLRFRLMLVFSGVAGLVVIAAAVGAEALVERAMWASIDASLTEEAETVATLGEGRGAESLVDAARQVGRELAPGPDKFVRVRDAGGRIIASFGTAPPHELAAPTPRTVWHHGRPFRIGRYVTPEGETCEIGVRVDREIAFRRRSRLAVGTALVLVLAALGSLAWRLTTQATGEIDRLAEELETIEAGSLDRRLAARRVAEVDRLASVLNRLLARLESAMASLRRFTADAAHELRTPIAALRTELEVAASAGERGLESAIAQTERLQHLAEELLTLSALEAAPPARERVDLAGIAREVADFFEPLAEEEQRPFSLGVDGTTAVRGSPGLLRRLLLNLVDNAFRHTTPPAAVDLHVEQAGGTVCVEVRDGGRGISDEERSRIFERFHRGRTGACGAGLGLAICREIVARHGGEISVESAPQGGTAIRVKLPAEPG